MDLKSSVRESYRQYALWGARSNEKVKALHAGIAQELFPEVPCNFEQTINTSILEGYKADITFGNNIISCKFVTSSYKKNAKNYVRNLLGEAYELGLDNYNIGFINIVRKDCPLVKDGVVYWEKFNDTQYYENLLKNGIPNLLVIADIPMFEKMTGLSVGDTKNKAAKFCKKLKEYDVDMATDDFAVELEYPIITPEEFVNEFLYQKK